MLSSAWPESCFCLMKPVCELRTAAALVIREFKIGILNIGSSALAAEICAGPHNRLLRRQHCSSLCSQSEGHEHVANMASALGHDFVGFLAVFGRHNIRGPHFASKVSYSASPQTFAECSRSAAPPLAIRSATAQRSFCILTPPTYLPSLSFRVGPHRCSCNSCRPRGRCGQ